MAVAETVVAAWVLIVPYWSNTPVVFHDFTTRERCEAAREIVQKGLNDRAISGKGPSAFCAPK